MNLANPDLEINNPEHKAIAKLQQTTLYFPHLADGGGYRSTFLVVNASDAPLSATLEFFSSEGGALSLPIDGATRTRYPIQLAGRQAARIDTDGSSPSVKWGWARLTAAERIYWNAVGGSVVLQAVGEARITSEAGVPSAIPLATFATYIDALGAAEAGIALANPNGTAVTLTFTLRDATGAPLAVTQRDVPSMGHLAQFVSQLFPDAGGVEGTLAVESTAPVAGIGLRYESVERSIFTTVPVSRIP